MGPKWAEEVPQSGPYLPGEGFRVPDVKCFEGQSGRVERDGQEGAMGEEKGGQISERSESHTEKSGLYPISSREQLEPCEQQINIIKGESYRLQFFVGMRIG